MHIKTNGETQERTQLFINYLRFELLLKLCEALGHPSG